MPYNMSDATPILLFIILGIIVFVISALAFIRQMPDHQKENNEASEYKAKISNFICQYHTFGGMDNEEIIRLEYIPGIKSELTYTNTGLGSDKAVKNTISVPKETSEKLLAIYNENKTKKWNKLKKIKTTAHDVSSVEVSFITNEGEFTINNNDISPEGSANIISEIESILKACIK